MKELFTNHKQALRLKRLGFNERCFGFYYRKELILFESCDIEERTNSGYVSSFCELTDCTAPLFQQALDFLLDKMNEDKKLYEQNTWSVRTNGELISVSLGLCVMDVYKTKTELINSMIDVVDKREAMINAVESKPTS